MAKFVIQSHGRLQEWIAEEHGYFAEEGLDYVLSLGKPAKRSAGVAGSEDAPGEIRHGAFESYAEGRSCNVSAACHWTVNMAASAGHGRMWGDAYSVTPSAIFVPPDSPIGRPEDLAGVPVEVGYHSGSHYSTLQALLRFLDRDRINLNFGGVLWDRLALLVDGKAAAGNAFGAPYYVLEQLGFRKIVDTTFMIGSLVTDGADIEDVKKYFRALRRAQRDLDLEPERYTHYFLRELPKRYHAMVDMRRMGPGERLVFEPYTREVFERTHRWMQALELFDEQSRGSGGYRESVLTGMAAH
ncbi:MAG: hypothetical protein OXI22_20475 [Defluviicoccus sp.]|nr:hypothetical protein [Defluviicoccus sp.]MDE0386268.1 hypothetical protein [Defluviicoccus sp.]